MRVEVKKGIVRLGAAAFSVGTAVFGPNPPDAGQVLQVLNNLRNPEKTAHAGEFSTSRIRLSSVVDAQGNYRILIPEVFNNATPDTRNCSTSWPSEPYYTYILSRLSVIGNLCIVKSEDAPNGAVYNQWERIWYYRDRRPNETYFDINVRHEICHVHQHNEAIRRGFSNLDDWLRVPEGSAWLNAADRVIRDSNSGGRPVPWSEDPNYIFGQRPLEDNANMCEIWYRESPISGQGREFVDNWPAIAEFARDYWSLNPSHQGGNYE